MVSMEDQGTSRLVRQWDKPDASPGPASPSFQHIWVTSQGHLLFPKLSSQPRGSA